MSSLRFIAFLGLGSVLLTACSSKTNPSSRYYDPYAAGDAQYEAARGKTKAYTFEDFVASPGYRGSRDYWRGAALSQCDPQHSYVVILLKEQRGRLYIKDEIAMDFPVCSGRVGGHETPRGTFRISQKERSHRSTTYGAFVDENDRIVKGGAKVGQRGPAGTHFKGADMPYWMRFNGAIGMHVGAVHREEASHGCVRVPEEACSILFEKLAVGSKVLVK